MTYYINSNRDSVAALLTSFRNTEAIVAHGVRRTRALIRKYQKANELTVAALDNRLRSGAENVVLVRSLNSNRALLDMLEKECAAQREHRRVLREGIAIGEAFFERYAYVFALYDSSDEVIVTHDDSERRMRDIQALAERFCAPA